jgi:hypothetical protein
MTELSADWVLPVDGPPIAGGRVRFEHGEIVEVAPGRAETHFADAVIVPGFVNAHSHLEYSLYAGFGDGQAFGPWIATHATRKNLLDYEDMLALARLGVADSLRSGITTSADYSFSGASATAATELGLRAIVYLEVFAQDPALAAAQYEEKRGRIAESALVRIGISPHAPYTCSLAVYEWCLSLGIPVGTHLAESASENDWLERGEGPWEGIAALLVPPTSTRARSPFWPPAECRSPTAPGRTPCSAVASRRWPSCAPQGSPWGSGRTRPPPRRHSTSSRRCGPRSTPPGRASGAPRRSSRPRRSASRRRTRPAPCEWTERWVP